MPAKSFSWTAKPYINYLAVSVTASISLLFTACSGGNGITTTKQINSITSVTVTPNPSAVTIGAQQQFSAKVTGTGTFSTEVTWNISATSLSPGTITSTGLYTTPYPAPPTITVTATSTQDATKSGSVTVTLNAPAVTTGPALTVDVGTQTHAISPDIYGMNAFTLDPGTIQSANIPVDRWGGDTTVAYNYKSDVTNDASDWYFENEPGISGDDATAVPGVSAFDALVESNATFSVKTIGNMPVIGWVAKDSTSCSFPTSTYPNQQNVDSYRGCGNGVYPNGVNGCTNSGGCNITGNDPTITSIAAPAPKPPITSGNVTSSWVGGWVTDIVSKFGPGGANDGIGGVAIYDLDNEPSEWDVVHFDVHPVPFSYDELTNNSIATAQAIKVADPTAQVSGPVLDFWWTYFYSKLDAESGWNSGPPCYQPWSNPVDRNAHNGTPFIEYYLQQFAAYEAANKVRLLDYLDLHTYYAATYNGNSVAFALAGDTGMQQARLNSTRAFWDPTYTDPAYQQPNYTTDPNYTSSCTPPTQALQLIPMMQAWVAKDYPGTKLAIDEYNWGGMEAINGALAQADILGIFGQQGLDLATLWPSSPWPQGPGVMAFKIYRNYDGAQSTFGDVALNSSSANQGALSVYGALRTSDNAVTVVVINKTYGDITDTLSLPNINSTGTAEAYLYSNANLSAIVAQPNITVTPPVGGSTTSTMSSTFPAQSITLLVIPQN